MVEAEIVSRSVLRDANGLMACRWCGEIQGSHKNSVIAHLKGCPVYQAVGEDYEDPNDVPESEIRDIRERITPSSPTSGQDGTAVPPSAPVLISPSATAGAGQPHTGTNGTANPAEASPTHVQGLQQEVNFYRNQLAACQARVKRLANDETHRGLSQALGAGGIGGWLARNGKLVVLALILGVSAWAAFSSGGEEAKAKVATDAASTAAKELTRAFS